MKTITLLALAFVTQAGDVAAQQAPAGANNPATKRVAFAQHCFWTGEMKLGQIEGVVRTEAGFFNGREVTLVEYAPERLALKDLARLAKQAGVADAVHLDPGSSASLAGSRLGSRSTKAIARLQQAIRKSRYKELLLPAFSSALGRPQK
ncbi:MAG: peptide-methionine (S)-S-oxide reductase [Verrucomicrobiota bacterium]|nr:peptide-methionine (S)-S-oxide reductase [Verrucomicrobiota bacterium]